MQVQLDSDMMKSLVSEAIMQSLDQSKRDVLIQGAIQSLLTPEKTGYGSRTESPIESAFRSAVHSVAERVAREMLANDPRVTDGIKSLLSEALDRLLVQNREKTVEALANSIAAGMAYRERG